MPVQKDSFTIRIRFWSLWVRWTVFMQLMVLVATGICCGIKVSLGGEWIVDPVGVQIVAAACGLNALGGVVVVAVSRWYSGAVLTPEGIRPFYPTGERDRTFRWELITSVKRHDGGVTGRWLWVYPLGGRMFVLPEHPADPLGVFDALERFAGPDHPLTLAFAHAGS